MWDYNNMECMHHGCTQKRVSNTHWCYQHQQESPEHINSMSGGKVGSKLKLTSGNTDSNEDNIFPAINNLKTISKSNTPNQNKRKYGENEDPNKEPIIINEDEESFFEENIKINPNETYKMPSFEDFEDFDYKELEEIMSKYDEKNVKLNVEAQLNPTHISSNLNQEILNRSHHMHTLPRVYMQTLYTLISRREGFGGSWKERKGYNIAAMLVAPDGTILSHAFNTVKDQPENQRSDYHAEANLLKNYHGEIPENSIIYSTLEPCTPCATKIKNRCPSSVQVIFAHKDDGVSHMDRSILGTRSRYLSDKLEDNSDKYKPIRLYSHYSYDPKNRKQNIKLEDMGDTMTKSKTHGSSVVQYLNNQGLALIRSVPQGLGRTLNKYGQIQTLVNDIKKIQDELEKNPEDVEQNTLLKVKQDRLTMYLTNWLGEGQDKLTINDAIKVLEVKIKIINDIKQFLGA